MLTRLINSLRTHRYVLILALLVSFLHGAHHLVMPGILAKENKTYYPTIIGVDEKYHSIAKAKEVELYGRPSGDISLTEYDGAPAFAPPIPYYAMGYLAKLTGSMTRALEVADFLIPPIIFILFYLLAFEVIGKRLPATLFASLSIFIPRYLAHFPLFTKYYQAWYLSQFFNPQYRMYFNRFEDPMLTVPFFLLALYLIFRALKRKEKYTPYLAGLAYGALFYAYFYYTVYLSVALGIGLALFVLTKKFDLAKRLGIIMGLGLVLSTVYWVHFFQVQSLPSYRDIGNRIGPEHGYNLFLYPIILFAYAQHTVLAVIMYFLYRKKNPTLALLFPALLLPVFAVYNFQIVTGFNPQPDHWIKPRQFILTLTFLTLGYELFKNRLALFSKKTVLPFSAIAITLLLIKANITKDPAVTFQASAIAALIAGTLALYFILKRFGFDKRHFVTLLTIFAVAVLFIKGAEIKRNFIADKTQEATLSVEDEKGLAWLNEHTPEKSVVQSLSVVSNTLIKHFTHNKLFVPDGYDTIASSAEIMERFMYANQIQGVSPEIFGTYFANKDTYPPKDEDHEGISFLFVDQFRAREKGSIFTNKGYLFPVWSDEEHAKVVNDYRAFLAKNISKPPYKLDYIYYGPREAVFAPDPITVNKNLVLEYNVAGVKIYRVPTITN